MFHPWNLNNNWFFKEEFSEEDRFTVDFSAFEKIHLPHTVKELPYNCFSHNDTALVTTYAKQFSVPAGCEGKRAILEFEGVMAQHSVYVNGAFAASHQGGYSRHRCDITAYLKEGVNTLIVSVDSREDPDVPPFGHTIDYLTFGGIYRNVNLYFANNTYIDTVLFRYRLEGDRALLTPEVQLVNHDASLQATVNVTLRDADGEVVKSYARSLEVPAGESAPLLGEEVFDAPHLWDTEDPYLYTAELTLEANGIVLDTAVVRTGFRTVACKVEGFFLNGKRIRIMGLNRHQSYPYVGYAMPARMQCRDAEILHDYLHVNTVRTSHYMQSREFLDRCDELGLLVFSEMPGWGCIGGEKFQENALNDIRDMITVQYNHPSIFIWSIRVNESADDDAFYTRTNALARSLDTSRPTTGVRCISNSHLLEDVYTYNDFVHFAHKTKHYREVALLSQQTVTGLPYKVPYLVSEYCGHIYPVKPFDCEEKQMRHVLIHSAVQSASMRSKDTMGAIGWCAFDYNTHGDYGSGDKICYHGVMDMFRNPKYAAQVYRSQISPEKEVVLEPATLLARGENDDNRPIPFVVLTNCDYIELELYGRNIGRFFPNCAYDGLPHPPILVDEDPGNWRDIWNGGTVIGFVNGEEVARRSFSADAYLADLVVEQDHTEINNTVTDCTRVSCKFVDQLGNLLPFVNGIVRAEAGEGLEIIGPDTVAAIGGYVTFYVKSIPNAVCGAAKITVSALNTQIPKKELSVQLKPDSAVNAL